MKYIFYHITDTHYYSKKNYDSDPHKLPQWNDQIAMRESEEIIKKAISIVENDTDTNTIIFTGDMTHHGDKDSSDEMTAVLDEFEKKGGNVVAFIDSHDYFDKGIRFDKNGKPYPKKGITREQALPIYKKYNVDKAISVYKDNFSCVIELFKGLRYIILSYEKTEKGPLIDGEYLEWIKQQAQAAEHDDCLLFGGIHPPFLSPSPMYDILGKGNILINNEKMAREFAKAGVQLVFSGHSHTHAVKCEGDEEGKPFYNIITASLVGSPPKMRKIEIDTDKMQVNVKTILLDVPELNLGIPLVDYCRRGFLGSLEKIPYIMEHDVDTFINMDGIELPKEFLSKHKKLVRFAGRKLNNLTFKPLIRFSAKITGMSRAEAKEIENEKVVPFILSIIDNLYSGDASIAPNSAKFKAVMGTVANIDSVIKVLPIDFKKFTGFDNLKTIVEPLVCNNGIDNNNAVLDLEKMPDEKQKLPEYKSSAGIKLLITAIILTIVLFPVIVVFLIAFLLAKAIKR